ncbi:hypothetical protein D5086_017421 [Populus alba]|uniref:Uncharacterized protein n=1 Tax=Populus alba TaxID=43335 RepID=A0ACC4BY88_POPAL
MIHQQPLPHSRNEQQTRPNPGNPLRKSLQQHTRQTSIKPEATCRRRKPRTTNNSSKRRGSIAFTNHISSRDMHQETTTYPGQQGQHNHNKPQ